MSATKIETRPTGYACKVCGAEMEWWRDETEACTHVYPMCPNGHKNEFARWFEKHATKEPAK